MHLYHQVDETIRCRIEARITAHYKGLDVKVRSATFTPGQGLTIRGLSIAEPGAAGPRAELLELEELYLACSGDLRDLALHDPDITEVVVRRGKLWVTRRQDGSWSAAKLFPWPRLSEHSPPTRIENASIEIFDPTRTPAATMVLRDVNLVFPPTSSAGQPAGASVVRQFQGTIAGDHVRQVAVEGSVDPVHLVWNVAGTADGLDITPELRDGLPEPFASRAAVLRGVYGRGELAFRMSYNPAQHPPLQHAVSGRLLQGRVEDPRLPYPLTDLRTSFRCDNDGFAIDELSARSGQAQLRLSCRAVGYELAGPLTIEGELRQFTLERRLRDFLPQQLKQEWDKYFPSGQVDAEFKLAYDGQRWRHDTTLTCRNGSFSYEKFPYRLDQVQGKLVFKDDVLRVDLTAPSGAAPIRMTAEATQSCVEGRLGWSGWFDAKGEDFPLDEKLQGALPEHARKVIRSLNPQGTCNFHVHMSRAKPEEAVHKYLSVYLNRCAMRFEHFPYPVRNIRGCLEMFDQQWTFTDMAGVNDTGQFTCQGYLQPAQGGGEELYLKIAGANVPLNKDLHEALRPNMQQLWSNLQPHGAVDLSAEVRYLSGSNQFHVAVQAQPQTENSWIEPVHFPYRLDKLHGTLDYRDGVVTLERIKAEHGAAKAAAAGRCEFRPDGSWFFRLDGLTVDRLPLDREFIQALPDRLRRTISELNPSGPINLRGTLEFEHGSQTPDPLQARWDLVLGVQRGSLDCGLKLENVSGEVSLVGVFDGTAMRSRGELALDSVTYKDRQFNQVLGPLWIDDDQVLLGSIVDRPRGSQDPGTGRQPRPITAKLFGGSAYGDAWIQLGKSPRYGVQATLTDVDLAQLARDMAAGRQNLGGKIQATLDLSGSGRSLNALHGHGAVRLRQGDVYELPVMVAMLKILSVRRPDKQAFNQCDIDYRISGNHAYLDRINFSGDAVSLDGKGDVDFSGRLQLDFHAIIGRSNPRLPLVREFMGEASQQIMLIHVGGTVQDPQVRNEALPGVNQVIQGLASPGGLLPGLGR